LATPSITDIIQDVAPEFSKVTPAKLSRFVGYAQLTIDRSVFGDKADLATAYLTAHILKMSTRKGVGGVVTMEKVGDLQRQYSMSPRDRELDQTGYGKEFKRIRRTVVITPFLI
jgi:hypothetical protein